MVHYDCRHCGASPLEDCDCHLKWKPVEKDENKIMSKNKITKCEYMNKEWVSYVRNHSVADIMTYFQSLPANAVFEADAGYNSIDSDVLFMREETDEEYDERMNYEANSLKRVKEAYTNRAANDRKNVEDAIAQLQEQLRNMP